MTEPVAANLVPSTMLALGDSYTIGECVDAQLRWPIQLSQLLRAEGLALAVPQIVARTGWTCDELEAALDLADVDQIQPPYALVSLLIGVNDQYRGRTIAEMDDSYQRLLSRALGYAGGESRRLIVLSIPDWSVTPFAADQARDRTMIAAEIVAYNRHCQRLCEQIGAAYVDITDLTREAHTRPALLAEDGLHPSGVDYGRWAQRVKMRLDQLGWPYSGGD